MSTVSGCDVTTVQQHYTGSTSTIRMRIPTHLSARELFDGSPPAVDATLRPWVLAQSLTLPPLISQAEFL